RIIKACGVKYCKKADPNNFTQFLSILKSAGKKAQSEVAVVISKSPCLKDKNQRIEKKPFKVVINDNCDGCGYCIREFECPALIQDGQRTSIDYYLCNNCGVCVYSCPKKAITLEVKQGQ
ncbi:MAG TPA: 4Fe-4S binding protein, partial [Nitrospirae bacterium]|nr:4Fe-4S binding protein [Nitrospirota bacterium]